jgi:hypothetical protein
MRTVSLVKKLGGEQIIAFHTDVDPRLSEFCKFLDGVDLGS